MRYQNNAEKECVRHRDAHKSDMLLLFQLCLLECICCSSVYSADRATIGDLKTSCSDYKYSCAFASLLA